MKSHSLFIISYFMLTLSGITGGTTVSAQGVGGPCTVQQTQYCESQCAGYSAPGYTQYCADCVNQCIETNYQSWEYNCYISNPVCGSSSQGQLAKKQLKKR